MVIKDVNQRHLATAISDLEKGYVDSVIALIKIPVFNKLIDTDLKKATGAKKKELENAKEMNIMQGKAHEESIESLNLIIKEVKKLRKKRFLFF